MLLRMLMEPSSAASAWSMLSTVLFARMKLEAKEIRIEDRSIVVFKNLQFVTVRVPASM